MSAKDLSGSGIRRRNVLLIDDATYQKWYERKRRRILKLSGASTASASTGSRPIPRSRTPPSTGEVSIKWFEDGITNVSYNCIDRHLEKRGDQVAIIWEGDNPYDDKKITYRELYEHVCRLANVLKAARRQEEAIASPSTCR